MIFEKGIFSSAYAGSVRYYATMLACKTSIIHTTEHHRKMPWCLSHCNLVGANGKQTLTLPLLKSSDKGIHTFNQLEISEHGDWRRTHWGAIFSAYGKSPFFEFIADDLFSIYENKKITNLMEFNKAIHNLVVDFLDLPFNTDFVTELPDKIEETIDFRGKVGEGKINDFTQDIPYWQVWNERHGFIYDLSIIDLLMTHGRESIFILHKMIKN